MSDEIMKIIKDHPNLQVYANVATEVVADDQASCYWLGKVKSAEVKVIAFVEPYGYNDQTIVMQDDYEDYYDSLVNSEEYLKLSDTEADMKAIEEINNLDFQEVILLNIGTI